MTEYPPNSRKAKTAPEPPEPKKVEQVTSAEVRRPKRGLGRQFKAAFIQGNSRDALTYMVEDVVVPTVRDMFVDAMQSGIDRLFYGDTRRSRSGYSTPLTSTSQAKVDYRSHSMGITKPGRTLSKAARSTHDFGQLIIPDRREAEDVIDNMFETLSRYGQVSVADLYVMTGIRPDHTDERWGWTSLPGAGVIPQKRRGGFLLNLPPTEELR